METGLPLTAYRSKLTARSGFTLIEVMVTVGIVAMLAGIVIVGINPARQISKTRNAKRVASVASIQSATNHYAIDTFGGYPSGIDETLRMIGTSSNGCAVSCGPDTLAETPSGITSFTDNTQAEFDAGSHNNTLGVSGITLSPAGLAAQTGTYVSQVKDAGSDVTWNSFGWMPNAPYGKELPTNQQTESGYPSGNAAMTNNVAYHRMNAIAAPITDSSGNNNNATIPSGGVSNTTGKFNGGFAFAGGNNNYLQIAHNANLNLPNTGGTVMLWIKPTITTGTLPQNTGMGILRKPDYAANIYSPGGYGLELYRNLTSQPAYIKMYLGWNSGLSNSQQILTGTTPITSATWHHVAITWNASTMSIYVNGALDVTTPRTSGPLNWAGAPANAPIYIGHRAASQSSGYTWFNGSMDELAIFSRQLSLPEITAAYQRGVFHPKLRLRTCNDAACSGETFIGPNGSGSTYFSEETSTSLTPIASFSLPALPVNRYAQYQLILDTDTTLMTPSIISISGANNGSPEIPSTPTTENTAEACLNLSPLLVPTYITEMPVDPENGNQAKTYYAVKKMNRDNLVVRACTPELGESIEVSQ